MVRGGKRKLSTRTEYPDQWERILQLSTQTEWSEEDDKEIDYLNNNYFGENVFHKAHGMGAKYTDDARYTRSYTIIITRPNGQELIFNSKKDAMRSLGMTYNTITQHIRQGTPVTRYGWQGCTIREVIPDEDKVIIAVSPDGVTQRFNNAFEASKALGTSTTSVNNSINQNRVVKQGKVKGWHFKKVNR